MLNDLRADEEESEYTLCTTNSLTATASDIPGPGRLLGKLYSRLGRKVERGISVVAVKMGYGPRRTAMRLRKLVQDSDSSNDAKAEKAAKRLVQYIR